VGSYYRARSATKDTVLLYFALVKSICGWILVAWMGGWIDEWSKLIDICDSSC